MVYEVSWTSIADSDFDKITEFLSETWSPEIAISFVQSFYKKLDLLSKMPFIGVKSEKIKDVRQVLVNSKVSILYKIQADKVILLRVIDNHSDYTF